MKDLNEVREIFNKDRFTSMVGVKIEEVGKHSSRCTLKIEDKHLNALGIPMGGAIFTLADVAFGAAAATEGRTAVTLSADISYCSKAKGDTLIAICEVVKCGKSTCLYRVDVKDNLDILVATALITGFMLE